MSQLIDRPIAVVIEPITELLSARLTDNGVAEITNAIIISVELVDVGEIWAVITSVPDPIIVAVDLVRIREVRAVVLLSAETILILI